MAQGFIRKAIHISVVILSLFCPLQALPIAYELNKKTELTLSAGLGIAGAAGVFLYDSLKNKPRSKQIYPLIGTVIALIAHGYFVQKTPEWKKSFERNRLQSLYDMYHTNCEQSCCSIKTLEAQLPLEKEDIADYARRVYKKSWALCLALNEALLMKNKASSINMGLEKNVQDINESISTSLAHAIYNKAEYMSSFEALRKELLDALTKSKQLLNKIDEYIRRIRAHRHYDTHVAFLKDHEADTQHLIQEHKLREQQAVLAAAQLAAAPLQAAFNAEKSRLQQQIAQLRNQLLYVGNNQSITTIESHKKRIKELAKRIYTLKGDAANTQDCPICCDAYEGGDSTAQLTTCCVNKIHKECANNVLASESPKCPYCRAEPFELVDC